jgi:hypothetical protein
MEEGGGVNESPGSNDPGLDIDSRREMATSHQRTPMPLGFDWCAVSRVATAGPSLGPW